MALFLRGGLQIVIYLFSIFRAVCNSMPSITLSKSENKETVVEYGQYICNRHIPICARIIMRINLTRMYTE
jgi:hypothetical protein